MTLSGQWIAQYAGTNSGQLIIEIDDLGGYYEGTACAWDNNKSMPSSRVIVVSRSKSDNQRLENIPVQAMFWDGTDIAESEIKKLQAEHGILFPRTVDIDFALVSDELTIKWVTPIGTTGGGVATASARRGGTPSELTPLPIRTWEGFNKHVNSLERKRYVYRGQENSKWRLRTTFHRTKRSSLYRCVFHDVHELNKQLSVLTKHSFDLDNRMHYAAFINLAQHHEYPTPLLDWTWSPYVAVFLPFVE